MTDSDPLQAPRDPETEAPSVNPDDPEPTEDPNGTPKENPSGQNGDTVWDAVLAEPEGARR
jgi:hypothetical protein